MKKALLTLIALAGAGTFSTLSQAQDAKTGDAARGKGKAQMCIGCHSIVGYQASFPEVYKVPKIAGQGAKYIVTSLQAYQKGERRHPSMRAIAGSLTDEDMADLAAFYEQQGKAEGTAAPEQLATPLPDALKDRLLACTACHGPNFSKPIDTAYPRLAGQHADYLYATLRAYTIDGNPHVGRANAVMRSQVLQESEGKKKPTFSNTELKQVAAYLSKLPGDLKTVPEPRLHKQH
ncbi:c-type cytochrome [Aquabacterium sp.]|uniref:c-type cytochrome n=1 Tax=Aquabacterium sp. TaxID=1872578 RepID=UPI002CA4220F|nr:c-type cytochrome [Aquabacterium sp.]HSW06523.1 c-type cytochrome [Aquabacterium sp.]